MILFLLIVYCIAMLFYGAAIVAIWFVALCIVGVDWLIGKIVRRP